MQQKNPPENLFSRVFPKIPPVSIRKIRMRGNRLGFRLSMRCGSWVDVSDVSMRSSRLFQLAWRAQMGMRIGRKRVPRAVWQEEVLRALSTIREK